MELNEQETEAPQDPILFEERMMRRVLDEEKEGEQYLLPYHNWCKEMHRYYYNAQNYDDLKEKNLFPSTAIQEDVDQFVADARDKLFYANRPCTIYGREDDDKADAEAKQNMIAYQDDEIGAFDIIGEALKDVALYRICAYQVEYDEDVSKEWESYEEIVPMTYEDGSIMVDNLGRQVPMIDPNTGQPVIDSGWRIVDVPAYKGAVVHRIDPLNLLWGQDKKSIDDEHPVMVRGNLSKKDMKKRYFMQENVQRLQETGEESQFEDPTWEKKNLTGENASLIASKKGTKYIEWQGYANKLEVYKYMLKTNQVLEEEFEEFSLNMSIIEPDEECWTICGVANNTTIIQLREKPFKKIKRSNIVLGNMAPGENSMIGDSLSRKIEAVQKAEQSAYGMLIENLKQSVDAFWIINKSAIVQLQGQAKVNKAGGILWTNENIRDVAMRVEQPSVSPDIYNFISLLSANRKNQGGLQDSVMGKGDPNAETLGEARQVLSYASLRMRDYLKTFEDSFVRKLYEMRNDINTEFLTEDYVYRVLGEQGLEWKQISPQSIRTPVDFVCESATRETNRSVIIQQMLQLIEVSSQLAESGFPARIDLMIADLAETGFAVSQDKIKQYFPTTEEQGALPQPIQQTEGNLPQPQSEEQAVVQNEAKNNVQI